MPLFRKEKKPFTPQQTLEVKQLLVQRRMLIAANQRYKEVLSNFQDLFSNSEQELLKNTVAWFEKGIAIEEKVPNKLTRKKSLLSSNSFTEPQAQILTEVVKELKKTQNLFLGREIQEKRKQLEHIVIGNEKRIAIIVKRITIIDKERTKINYWGSLKQLFTRNKVKPEEVQNKSSENAEVETAVVGELPIIKTTSEQAQNIDQAMAESLSLKWQANNSKAISLWLDEQEKIAQISPVNKTSYWQSFKKLFTRNKVKPEEVQNKSSENAEVETAVVGELPIIKTTSEQASTDIYKAIALEDSLRRFEKNGKLIGEWLDEQEQLTNYNVIEETEIKNLKTKPIIPKKIWLAADQIIATESVNEPSSQPNSDVESDELDDQNGLLMDYGYYTQSSSNSEIDDEPDTLVLSSTNTNSTLRSQMNSLPNQIVLEKVKNLTWKIQQKSENNNKISKKIILKKEEDNVLENLIKEYKRNIMITFDKNSKKFKEAFVIDNQGNKKKIVINESKKIIALEQVFAKATKTLARSWNDSYVDIANKLEKEQSLSNASKLKTHNEKKWIRHLGKI